MSTEQVTEQDEVTELDTAFFDSAILTRPGENIIEVISRERGLEKSGAGHDGGDQ